MLQKGMYNYRAKLTNLVVSMHKNFFFIDSSVHTAMLHVILKFMPQNH